MGLAIWHQRGAGMETQDAYAALDFHPRFDNRLSHLAHYEIGHLSCGACEGIGCTQQRLGTLGGRGAGPLLARFAGTSCGSSDGLAIRRRGRDH
jgi:hypothetical protein